MDEIAIAVAKKNKPTNEQVTTAVNTWLDDHPEATTTVQDLAITKQKLDRKIQIRFVPIVYEDILRTHIGNTRNNIGVSYEAPAFLFLADHIYMSFAPAHKYNSLEYATR